ncbi:MAG: DUF3662 and FHA domain-containing protein [Actinomycetota bacterium]
MGILQEFERRVEGLVEGFFARAFRSGVQPVELGKRLLRALEDGKTLGVSHTYVPNVHHFTLAGTDYERFVSYRESVAHELASLVRDAAAEHHWALLGPVRIEMDQDPRLTQGTFRLESRVQEAQEGEDPQEETIEAPGPVGPAGLAGPISSAKLAIDEPDATPWECPLRKGRTVIGRLSECDIVLSDPGVSRRHAAILRHGDEYSVEDLGSTNGTRVNSTRITRRRLADGDRIVVGSTNLHFQMRED